jgi:hypothetical protein
MSNNENQHPAEGTTNAERDQDEGKMNNGALGGSMGISGSSNDADEEAYGREQHDGGSNTVKGDTGGGADNGSKAGSRLGLDGGSSNAGGQAEGSAAENI